MGAKRDPHDARRYPRLKTGYLLRYDTGRPGVKAELTNLEDISAGGVKFVAAEPLPEKTSVRVEILLAPLEKKFQADAKILRLRKMKKLPGYAVAASFTDIPYEQQEALKRFVESWVQNPKDGIRSDQALAL